MVFTTANSDSLEKHLTVSVTNRLEGVTVDLLDEIWVRRSSDILDRFLSTQDDENVIFLSRCFTQSRSFEDFDYMIHVIGLLAKSQLYFVQALLETLWVMYASHCDRFTLRKYGCHEAAALVLEKNLLKRYRRRMSI